ncbi:MAG TPA: hypothetical protein VNT81_13055 [Vicinamibacterales bacterium]|nr:hypothetical protein [Vicinamibacterales bacterium]
MIAALCVFLFASALGWWSLQELRLAGAKPFFYQSNFEPAVLLACGEGFGLAVPPSPALNEFLAVRRDAIDCSEIADISVRPLTTAAHANWYYMYAAVAAVWKVTGVSWAAVDFLVAALAGVTSVAVFGIFRLVAPIWLSLAVVALLMLSPHNLAAMLSLRDYSKAPFVLVAVWILGWLALRPAADRAALLLAAAYGAVVGVGYGFRGDLIVMVPIGAVFVLLFLPDVKSHLRRAVLAPVVLVVTFAVVAWPVLSGMSLGGCQYHFALLGVTTPLTEELRLEPAAYRFGDHLSDTFVDLKVGDYASRILGEPAPNLCDANYDRASGDLYRSLVTTMPADMLVRAYSSVLSILRASLHIPEMVQPVRAFPRSELAQVVYRSLGSVSSRLAIGGPILMLVALVMAWYRAPRLGLALTFLVLVLGGYPAVQFEARHWFHLRFMPWWAGAAILMSVASVPRLERSRMIKAAAAVVAVIVGMALVLTLARYIQSGSVEHLRSEYRALSTESLQVGPAEGGFLPVQWTGLERGSTWQRRGSDLLVVKISGSGCGEAAPLVVKTRYNADAPTYDLSETMEIRRSSGDGGATLFIPVFRAGVHEDEFLRFAGLEVVGAPPSCVTSVARATSADRIPLWLQFVDSPSGGAPFYETMRPPRLLNR